MALPPALQIPPLTSPTPALRLGLAPLHLQPIQAGEDGADGADGVEPSVVLARLANASLRDADDRPGGEQQELVEAVPRGLSQEQVSTCGRLVWVRAAAAAHILRLRIGAPWCAGTLRTRLLLLPLLVASLRTARGGS